MEIALTEEQQALKSELRAYYENLLTPELEQELSHAGGIGPVVRKVVKQMGSDGWLGIGWPTEWGGQGRSAVEQFIFFDESMRSGAPVPMLTINTVGPTIMNFGTQEQKEFFLPKILAGEISFCIGYTEPNSGTDLASLTTRAVRDGDEYVINGAKIFTSLAGDADYIWLATRTDPNAAKHKGISMFVIPMNTPGIRVVPMKLLGDHNINYTFYEDVRVPATSLVGGENQGWNLITNQLNHERVTLCSPGIIERVLTDVRGVGPDHQAARRSPCHRPGMGAGAPGPGVRGARVPPPHQLEGGVAGDTGAPGRRRRLVDQGVRHGVLPAGLPVLDGDPGAGRLPDARLTRRSRRRAPGDVRPLHDHPHLRWRHQRDPAGPHRDLRPRHAAVAALSPSTSQEITWTSTTAKSRRRSASWRGRSSASGRPHDRLKEIEATAGDEGPFDRDLWRDLANAGLLGIHLSEDVGGAGLDFVAACLVVEAAGRTAAYVPVVETMVYGAEPIDRFGTDAQRKAWLTGVASGETILTAAMAELAGEVILPGGG